MKKVFLALMAVAAITLTSCLGKTAAPGQATQTAEAPADADDVTKALADDLNSGDQGKFTARIAAIFEKLQQLVGQDPEAAKQYFTKAQDFLKQNKDQVTKLVGGNDDAKGLIDLLTQQDATSFFKNVAGVDLNNLLDKVPDAVKDAVPDQVKDIVPGL